MGLSRLVQSCVWENSKNLAELTPDADLFFVSQLFLAATLGLALGLSCPAWILFSNVDFEVMFLCFPGCVALDFDL